MKTNMTFNPPRAFKLVPLSQDPEVEEARLPFPTLTAAQVDGLRQVVGITGHKVEVHQVKATRYLHTYAQSGGRQFHISKRGNVREIGV